MSKGKDSRAHSKRCQQCNKVQSVIWTKCPHCMFEQCQTYNSLLKRFIQRRPSKRKQSLENNHKNSDDLFEDIEDESEQTTKLMKQRKPDNDQQIQNGALAHSRNPNRLVQNNLSVDNSQNQVNYKIDGSIGKYIIMFLILLIFLTFLLWDISVLRYNQLTKNMSEVDQCKQKYNNHLCEKWIEYPNEFQRYCLEWKECKEKDPAQNIQMLKLVTLYFADITSQSVDTMNSKVVGIILLIYFFGLILSHFLNCVCPRRK